MSNAKIARLGSRLPYDVDHVIFSVGHALDSDVPGLEDLHIRGLVHRQYDDLKRLRTDLASAASGHGFARDHVDMLLTLIARLGHVEGTCRAAGVKNIEGVVRADNDARDLIKTLLRQGGRKASFLRARQAA